MSQKIANSLVTISPINHPSEVDGAEKLDRSLVKSFWQAFFTSRQASDREKDRRLEYLFWRIWSSDHLLGRIDIKYLDGLVSRIMASEPISSPRHSQNTFLSPESSQATPTQALYRPESKSMLVEGVSEPESLHPILKPPQASHSEPPKTTRILITQPDGEEITQNPSNSPTPSIVEPKGSIPDRLTPRRSSLVIPGHSKRGGKRRPVMTARRKSSQGVVPKAQGTPKKHNGKSKNTGPTEEIFDDDDDMTSERTKPKSIHRRSTRDATWADLDHDQPYLDFPVTGLTPAATSLLKDGKSGHPAITITPADLPFTDLRFPEPHDPILSQSQGVQTVSDKPDQRSQATQTEIQDNSLSNNIPGPYDFRPYKPVKRTPVPGYHDATRTPMPRAMTEALVDTILDNTPLKGFIPAPDRPLHYFNHPWHELPRPNFLFDFMIKAPSPSNHQPSRRSLVPKNFRQEWTDFIAEENLLLAESIAENEAAKESLSFIQEGRRLCQGTSTQFDSDSEISRGLSSREMPSQELQAHQTTRQQQSDTPSEIDIDQILRELQAEYSSC